jgi:hypothetical protein
MKGMDDILKQAGLPASQFAPWRLVDANRRARYAGLFEGELALNKDPQLRHLSEAELEVRRCATELAMDNMVMESTKTIAGKRGITLNEATESADAAAFRKWSLPLVRKFLPKVIAFDVADVRTVPLPSFPVFTLDHQYDSAGGLYAAGTSIYDHFDPDYADDPGEGTEPKKIKAQITSETVTCTAKKLLTDYTIEALQDFDAYHDYSLRKEMVGVLGAQILRERNAEIITAMIGMATTNTNWESTQPATPDPWANATPKEYVQSLWDALADANAEIWARVYEDANVLVCGKNAATMLQKVEGFKYDKTASNTGTLSSGPINMGVLKEQYKVYKDPDMDADTIILAHKSENWLNVGLVHCVYVPLWISPEIPDTTFTFAQGVMSRYANYEKRGDFFATVTLV